MKKIILIFLLVFLLLSCSENNDNNSVISDKQIVSVENDRNIENQITINPDLYGLTTEITFHDPKDIENFKKSLISLDDEIKSNTGLIITTDQLFEKARLLDYLGETGKALELYEQNFDKDNNDRSVAYNHNMARLYEVLGNYDDAINRYDFLIKYFNRGDYYKDIAEIWKKRGDEEKYNSFMELYNKAIGNKDSVKID